jgi:plastocyanin
VADRTYVNGGTDLQATVLTSTASHWNTAIKPVVVTVADSGYAPASVTVGQGGVVRWSFAGSKSHSVTDTQRLGPARSPSFDSGLKSTGKFGFAFAAAGSYAYGSTAQKDGKFAGTVQVPMTVQPAIGGVATVFTVTWSSRSISGYVFDVEARFKKAGTNKWTAWSTWQNGVTSPSAMSTPTLGAGTYAFHARLRQVATGSTSGWSTDLTVLVQ